MQPTGMPLNGGNLSLLPGGATQEQLTAALNDIITRLNSELGLKSFGNGSNDLMQYGTLADGSLGVLLNDDKGNLVASFSRRADNSIGARIYDGGNLITEFGKTASGSIGSKFFDSTGKGLALFGKYPDGNIRLRIAKAGFDVETATVDELIFNSEQNVFKVANKLSTNFSVTSTSGGGATVGTGTASIAHNLGYTPLTLSTVSITSDWNGNSGIFPLPYFVPATNSGVDAAQVFIIASFVRVNSVNNSAITYAIGELAGGSTIAGTITCYILQETAT